MQSGSAAERNDRPAKPQSDLDSRYRKVGISAVLAALPYQSERKNPAYARTEGRVEERFLNATA